MNIPDLPAMVTDEQVVQALEMLLPGVPQDCIAAVRMDPYEINVDMRTGRIEYSATIPIRRHAPDAAVGDVTHGVYGR